MTILSDFQQSALDFTDKPNPVDWHLYRYLYDKLTDGYSGQQHLATLDVYNAVNDQIDDITADDLSERSGIPSEL